EFDTELLDIPPQRGSPSRNLHLGHYRAKHCEFARVFRRRMTTRVERYQIIDSHFGNIQHYGYAGGKTTKAGKPLQHNCRGVIRSLAFIHIEELGSQIEDSENRDKRRGNHTAKKFHRLALSRDNVARMMVESRKG